MLRTNRIYEFEASYGLHTPEHPILEKPMELFCSMELFLKSLFLSTDVFIITGTVVINCPSSLLGPQSPGQC